MNQFGRFCQMLMGALKRGWSASYHEYKTHPKITKWSWPFWSEAPMTPPVHVLTGANDWQHCAWMLASFFHFTENTWRIFIHDDGTLPEEARVSLKKLLPRARIIVRDEADTEMDKALAPHPFCHDYRNKSPLALKIFDMAHFNDSERFLVVDSSLLFFTHPREIVDWAITNDDSCWFIEDVAENGLLSAEHAWDDLGIKLWARVSTGLGLVAKKAIDFEFCERALGETSILKGDISRVEKTLFALCASRHGKGGLLPKSYEVTLAKNASSDCVARHYIDVVRDQFFGEGLRNLHRTLLAPEKD